MNYSVRKIPLDLDPSSFFHIPDERFEVHDGRDELLEVLGGFQVLQTHIREGEDEMAAFHTSCRKLHVVCIEYLNLHYADSQRVDVGGGMY